MQEGLLKGFVRTIEEKKLNVEGVLVLQGAKAVAEHRWVPEQARNLYSVSKSFLSTAVGIAIGEGKLSLDDRVVDVLASDVPPNADKDEKLSAMTLKHLLMMSSGHAEGVSHASVKNWVRYFLNVPLAYPPGTHFAYNNGATYIASAMLQQVVGETALDYLMPRLFEPLGIERPQWDACPQGRTCGFSQLHLKTSQMAKLGQLYLQRGKWEGKQLVPEVWVQQATAKQIDTPQGDHADWSQGYGYQFWQCSKSGVYRADGMKGQYIIVVPAKDAVIAINSDEDNMGSILDCVWSTLYPLL